MASKSTTRQEDARRFASRLSAVIIAIGAAVALVVAANRWDDRDVLRRVAIEGRVVLDSAEILSRAVIDGDAAIEELDFEAIERGVASHPYITRAAVYRGGPGTLTLEIVERTPVAIMFLDDAPFYVDSQAVLLPYRFSAATFDVPVLSGVADGSRPDSALARAAVGVAEELRRYDEVLYRSISEIRCDGDGELVLIMADGGIPIHAGRPGEVAGRLRKLQTILSTLYDGGNMRRLEYIDLRWNGQVVVKWADGDGRT